MIYAPVARSPGARAQEAAAAATAASKRSVRLNPSVRRPSGSRQAAADCELALGRGQACGLPQAGSHCGGAW
ncbi:hypothetical protein PR202_ga03730 [Eleusine coracana subsp. coracana]|uniref:Uncharacterized protein n=1 Tax=Eleusine coracana subsp. coracana TaxID=191504 RepID=A0AAV5BQ50_ELECO|nr:hypothetical protein PR202_ga03730 [Eleusine coracana subsp. coracana]